jgi:hypothetical protein
MDVGECCRVLSMGVSNSREVNTSVAWVRGG